MDLLREFPEMMNRLMGFLLVILMVTALVTAFPATSHNHKGSTQFHRLKAKAKHHRLKLLEEHPWQTILPADRPVKLSEEAILGKGSSKTVSEAIWARGEEIKLPVRVLSTYPQLSKD